MAKTTHVYDILVPFTVMWALDIELPLQVVIPLYA